MREQTLERRRFLGFRGNEHLCAVRLLRLM
ncbi:Uncharacterised protein [Mycobacteroides abscessus subsp. abscessus]|nr:Uncharacterised protein [Mycobacteroides abscessus subsp. abscessus]